MTGVADGSVEQPPPSRGPRWTSWVLSASAAVIAVGGIVLLFVLGTRAGGGGSGPALDAAPAPTVTVTATPTPTAPEAAPQPTVQAPPGTHPWTDLAGGECLDPFTSPWAEELTVVDCAQPHAAQLVGRPVISSDPAASYPGEAAITAGLGLACTAPEVLSLDAAAPYPDLTWQASYPVTEEQWAAGLRAASCFVTRGSGEPITGSLAAAG
ncbi:septum formation family protein [Cnuibacter sp. UC19_7]|uniref:septum formation family protein n=1 Tax=Cnuibacter sp. UC19_7 TaxID=3350166 RepID=UPI0036719F5E